MTRNTIRPAISARQRRVSIRSRAHCRISDPNTLSVVDQTAFSAVAAYEKAFSALETTVRTSSAETGDPESTVDACTGTSASDAAGAIRPTGGKAAGAGAGTGRGLARWTSPRSARRALPGTSLTRFITPANAQKSAHNTSGPLGHTYAGDIRQTRTRLRSWAGRDHARAPAAIALPMLRATVV